MEFSEATISHNLIYNESFGLLVVGSKVLDCCCNAMGLDGIDVGSSELSSKERIIPREGFEISAAER
jgi:hypothetical protein